jgi:hypothetical protein
MVGEEGFSAEAAAAAVAAEERAWRVFLARRGAQFAFAREATGRRAPPRRAAAARRTH